MIKSDQQLGRPGTPYTGTKAAIEALTGVPEGAVAYATDQDRLGSYNAAAWAWNREILQAARTYYVNPSTGNDTNNGLTSGTAFLTIQKAVNVIVQNLDVNGKQVEISLADSTAYQENVVLSNAVGVAFAYPIVIKGNAATPANVRLTDSFGDPVFKFDGRSGEKTTWWVKDLEVRNSGAGASGPAGASLYVLNGGRLEFSNIRFTNGGLHLGVDTNGELVCAGNCFLSLTANAFMQNSGGYITLSNKTFTFLANCTFNFFVISSDHLAYTISGATFTLGAFSATGARYQLTQGRINAPTTTHFPGNAAGTMAANTFYGTDGLVSRAVDSDTLDGSHAAAFTPIAHATDTALHTLTLELKEDTTARTYNAGSFYSLGAVAVSSGTPQGYFVLVRVQYDGDGWHEYEGACVIAPIGWKASGTKIATSFPMEQHNGADITCSIRFADGNASRNLEVSFSANVVVAAGGRVRAYLKKIL